MLPYDLVTFRVYILKCVCGKPLLWKLFYSLHIAVFFLIQLHSYLMFLANFCRCCGLPLEGGLLCCGFLSWPPELPCPTLYRPAVRLPSCSCDLVRTPFLLSWGFVVPLGTDPTRHDLPLLFSNLQIYLNSLFLHTGSSLRLQRCLLGLQGPVLHW